MENNQKNQIIQELKNNLASVKIEVNKFRQLQQQNASEEEVSSIEENIYNKLSNCARMARQASVSFYKALATYPQELLEYLSARAELDGQNTLSSIINKAFAQIGITPLDKAIEAYNAEMNKDADQTKLEELKQEIQGFIQDQIARADKATNSIVDTVAKLPKQLIQELLEEAEFEEYHNEIIVYRKALKVFDSGNSLDGQAEELGKTGNTSDSSNNGGLYQAIFVTDKNLPNNLQNLSIDELQKLLEEAFENENIDSIKILEEEINNREQKIENSYFQGIGY